MEDECSICLNKIINNCNTNCNHHFCYDCLILWCLNGGNDCPMCKQRLFQIKLENNFDLKNNIFKTKKITIDFNIEEIFNMKIFDISVKELKNNDENIQYINNKKIGLKIVSIDKNNFADKYFKINDIILYINGIPCINGDRIRELIYYHYDNKKKLEIELLKLNNNCYRFNCYLCEKIFNYFFS